MSALTSATESPRLKLKPGLQFYPCGDLFHAFDPATSRHFRMGPQEVEWLNLLDGCRSIDSLRDHIPQEHFEEFVSRVERLELLDGRSSPTRRDVFRLKLPIVDPNPMLDSIGALLVPFRTALNRCSPFLLLLNLVLVSTQIAHARHLLSAIHPTLSGFVFYGAALLIMGFVHESSHAIVARSFGVNVPSLGIMLLYLQPAFYADVSGIGLLREHGPRINVLLAGVMANNLLLTVSLIAFVLAPVNFGAYVGYFALMNATAILLNLIPFIESDGYFILQELLAAAASSSSGGGGRATSGQFRSPLFSGASAVFSAAASKRRVLTWKRKMMR
jgi:putative peptide zinc metalloprotease protein